jgi:hypothetical protein
MNKTKPNRYQIRQLIKKTGITKAQFIAMQEFSDKLNQKKENKKEENKKEENKKEENKKEENK